MLKFQTISSTQTKEIAKLMAQEISKGKIAKHATIITLKGNLGAGKTTFIQGFLRGLGVKSKITSPTFVITKSYPLRQSSSEASKLKTTRFAKAPARRENYHKVFHYDCYRIHSAKEIADLNWKEIISDPKNIVLIEWPERISKILPKDRIQIIFKYGKKEHEREIIIK